MNPQSTRSRMQDIVAKRVSALRIGKRLTQEGLARATGLNYTHIGKIESGKRLASLKSICKLANALDVEPHELLVTEETARAPDYKKQQLIKIFNESGPEEIEIYFKLISALHKKSVD